MNFSRSLFLLCSISLILSNFAFAQSSNLSDSLKVNISNLKAQDGQILIIPMSTKKTIPSRPANADALPETDALHWYDMEYAGWNAKKVNIPASPANGAIGKKVIMIVHGEHPWTTACIRGGKKIADAYKMTFKAQTPNPSWDVNAQDVLIDQAIKEKPDAIFLIPLDAQHTIAQAKKINDAGIPLFLFNSLPDAEAMNYSVTWSGPDDFGQHRMLAKAWATELQKQNASAKEIGVAYLQHNPGSGAFYARYFGPLTELIKFAPKIKTLAAVSPGLGDAAKAEAQVSAWLKEFGTNLKGIYAADDDAYAIGIYNALKKANRLDIVVVAAGNGKTGTEMTRDGKLFAINYQTAEGDGALAVKLAADWFNGKKLEAVNYLPQMMITKSNATRFLPTQW